MVEAALLGAYWLRIGSGILPYQAPADFARYLRASLISLPIWLTLFLLVQLYDHLYLLGGPQEYGNVLKGCTCGVLWLIVLSFWQRSELMSRGWLLIAWLLSVILVAGARFIARRIFFALRHYGLFIIPIIIAGANEQGKAIVRQLIEADTGVRVVGFVDDFLPLGAPVMEGLEVLGRPTMLAELVARHGVREVIVISSALAWESFEEIIRQAGQPDGFQVQLSPGLYEILTTGVEVTHKGFVPLLRVQGARITGIDAVLKLALDYGLGALLTLLAAPLMLLIGLGIWVTDGRPILELHPVLGLGGRVFRTLKFRTGLLGATRRCLAHQATFVTDNPEHTWWLGRLLYRTGLDKLLQLANVLRSQMSLVGPRTISAGSEGQYKRWFPNLLTVKPGVTGTWAVANVSDIEDEMRLNMYYIRNWTIWLDLQILFQSARYILMRGRRR